MISGNGSQHGLTRLAAKYNEMMRNGRVLSNRHSIAILRDRIETLIGRMDENDAPDRLNKIEKLWEDYKDKKDARMDAEAVVLRARIDEEFEKARTDFAIWNQLLQVLDLDRKMVESEVKIAKEIKAIMTAEEGVEMAARLLASVITAVGAAQIAEYDKGQLLKRVEYEFGRIIGENIGAESAEGLGASVGEIIDA